MFDKNDRKSTLHCAGRTRRDGRERIPGMYVFKSNQPSSGETTGFRRGFVSEIDFRTTAVRPVRYVVQRSTSFEFLVLSE